MDFSSYTTTKKNVKDPKWKKIRFLLSSSTMVEGSFIMFVCAHVRQVIIPFTLRLLLENTHLWLVLLHICNTMWGMNLLSIVEEKSINVEKYQQKKPTWKCARQLNITFSPIHGTENRKNTFQVKFTFTHVKCVSFHCVYFYNKLILYYVCSVVMLKIFGMWIVFGLVSVCNQDRYLITSFPSFFKSALKWII